MNAISKEIFEGLDIDSKLNILFAYVIELHESACVNEIRTTKMEGKFAVVATVFGILGAVIVSVAKWLTGK